MFSIRSVRTAALSAAVLTVAASRVASAQSVLVLNGYTPGNRVDAALIEAGFNVIDGTLEPGQISSALATYSDIVEIWIWNDGTYGNTGSPADPAFDFDANDLADLATFQASHPHFVMDSFAWRYENANPNDRALSKNEALALFAAGGGIVLGTDDDSGDALVQHVNQVASYFGFAPFHGTYQGDAAQQAFAGALFTGPDFVDPTQLVTTVSSCDVPHGLQPNGQILRTVVFGANCAEEFGYPSALLGSDSFGGAFHESVCHYITTTIPAGDSQDFVSFCFADGTGTPCRCGNDYSGGGCANSTGVGGRLVASGTASITNDDLVFVADQLPPNVFGILFAGSSQIDIVFGDGLRCAGAPTLRFGVQSTGGSGTFTRANIASYASYSAGDRRYFQGWHRDPTGPCGKTTNVTNAIAVEFTP